MPPSLPPSKLPATTDASDGGGIGDPVDALVAELSASPMWDNGAFPTIDLPASATTDDVVAAVLTKVSFDRGPVTSHRVARSKTVTIGRETSPHVAAVVETNQGPKIVLLRHGPSGFWSRVYPLRRP